MDRPNFLHRIDKALQVNPVVALLGPRQCGKTTLARMFSERRRSSPRKGKEFYFDLGDPTDLARLENPKLALQDLEGLVVIDEIQKAPGLFSALRVLVDRKRRSCQFLILGSASRDLIRQSSESLAGRISFIELTPFNANEVGMDLKKLWLRGGFPPSFLARTLRESTEWRKSYISTFLERDIPNLGIQIPAASLRRFWLMLTHYHGQIFNASEMARSLGVADTTTRRYLDILSGTFMVRQLPPWWENVGKRQVKSPKIYFRDTGVLHTLLGLQTEQELMTCPKLGASWEGFALEETIRWVGAADGEIYFWATHNQAELDLFVLKDGKRRGFEFKYTDSPKMTQSMQIALHDLKLKEIKIIFPGNQRFPLHSKIEAVGLEALVASQA